MTNISILTKPQQAVYLASLELGTDTIQHIAQKASLPRSTVYLIIDELIDLGLISQTKKGKKTLITAESPDKLISLTKQKQASLNQSLEQLQSSLPQLQAIHNAHQHKPLVSFYKGFEGIKTVLEKTLQSKEICLICSGGSKPMNKSLLNYMYNTYLPKTDKKNIKTKEIITKTDDYNRYIKEYASKNHLIKVQDKPMASHHLDKLIFGNTVAIIDYDSLNATLITHAHITEFERTLFNQLWQSISS